MIHAKVPAFLWPYAFKHAVYINNRLLTSILGKETTPYIEMFHHIPDERHIKVFGCDAYALMRNVAKHGPRGCKGIYVGQSDDTTGYIFYNPETRSTSTTNHIRFNEDVTVAREWTEEDEESLVKEATCHSECSDDLPLEPAATFLKSPSSAGKAPGSSDDKDDDDDSDDDNKEEETLPVDNSLHDIPGDHGHNLSTPSTKVKKAKHDNPYPRPTQWSSTRSGRAYAAHSQGALVCGEHFIQDETTPDSMDMFTIDKSMTPQDIDKWFGAIDSELKYIVERDVWTIINANDMPKGKTLVNYKWVMKVKHDESNTVVKHKARLCAKGFTQKEGIDYKETFAPVARHTTFKLLLSLGAVEHFKYKHVDIKTAFLYGDLHEEVYMKMPPYVIKYMQDKHNQYMDVDIKNAKDYVLRLNKALYGLKQAPREWYAKLDEHIRSMGFTRSKSDVCVYFKGDRANKMIMMIYVDDIIIASKHDALLEETTQLIKSRFNMESDALHYYVGMQIAFNDTNNTVKVCQTNYIKRICQRVNKTSVTSMSTPMTTSNKLRKEENEQDEPMFTEYRSHVSSIMYAALLSRPDVTYPTNVCARYMGNPGQQHMNAVMRIYEYLYSTADKVIQYKQPDEPEMVNRLVCYVDTSHADSDDLRTTCGYIIYLNGGPISWRTLLHKGHCQSPTESEYVGMFHSVCEVLSLRNMMEEIGYAQTLPTTIHEDNEGSIKVANNPRCHDRLKHIDLKYHLTRDAIEEGKIAIEKIGTADQQADILTKPLAKLLHWKHANKFLK
jgi:hypothetical protein